MNLPSSFGNYFASQVYFQCERPKNFNIVSTFATWVPRLFPSDNAYASYWIKRRRCAQRLLQSKYLIRIDEIQNTSVMHFRCGDVPFNRHRIYRMPSVPYLDYVAHHVAYNNLSKAEIYWTPSHTNNQTNIKSCIAMLTQLEQFFKAKHISIKVVDEPNAWRSLHAFSKAKLLVSLVPSSFVFSVGVTRGMHFITPFLGLSRVEGIETLDVVDTKRARDLASIVPWIMSTHQSLPVGQVLL